MFKICYFVVGCYFYLSWSRCPISVAMEGGKKQRRFV